MIPFGESRVVYDSAFEPAMDAPCNKNIKEVVVGPRLIHASCADGSEEINARLAEEGIDIG
jgi:hypothetical protein